MTLPIEAAPKVVLHDHLDGGLRPGTVIDLAAQAGYDGLPSQDAAALGVWFRDAADSGSLVRYLETFAHTVAVMQTPEALHRVACETVEDLAADGVVYAESRYAPRLHTASGLPLSSVIEAVNEGLREGERRASDAGRRIVVRSLVTAIRHDDSGEEIAELAVKYRDHGVAGFDIAGAEDGFPPRKQLAAFSFLSRANAHFTIHAGEAFGLPSIWEALQVCGADRLGHGVRIVDDLAIDGVPWSEWLASGPTTVADVDPARVSLGRLAAYVRDRRIPLEMCPSSNLQTGAAATMALHPITLLKNLRFRVTVNTDNRLMSGTSMSREMHLLAEAAGWSMRDFEWASINAMKSAFLPFDQRLAIITDQIKPGYAALA